MRKLIKHFIDYGYLLREINDLLLFSYRPEAVVYKFDNETLGMIADRIFGMHNQIEELKKQLKGRQNGSGKI